MDKLPIKIIDYTLKGSGQTIGKPCILITLEVQPFKSWKDFKDVITPENLRFLKKGAIIRFGGSEPLLFQKEIGAFLYYFKKENGFIPFIEMTTNGNVVPDKYLLTNVSYWEVTPNTGKASIMKELDGLNTRFIFDVGSEPEEKIWFIFDVYSPAISVEKIAVKGGSDPKEMDWVCKKHSIIYQFEI